MYESIICISDLQIPFHHPDSFEFLAYIKSKFYRQGKTLVINQGDEVDFHAFSMKYKSDPDGMSPGDELKQAKRDLQPLFELFPEQYFCLSNHMIRPYLSAFNAGLPRAFLREFSEVMGAPRTCQWQHRWVFDGICFEHGEGVSGVSAALNAAIQNRMRTSIGHQHVNGGIIYQDSFHDSLWGMNTGCLIDITKYAFQYARKTRKKPSLGLGVILDQIPLFYPMRVDKYNRWIGR